MNIDQRIFDLFKNHARHLLERNTPPDLEECFTYLSEQQHISLTPQIRDKMANWFHNVFHLAYLNAPLAQDDLNEIILHDPKRCQTIGRQKENISLPPLSPQEYQESLEVFARLNQADWNYRQGVSGFFTKLKGKFYRATLCHKGLGPQNVSKLFLRRIRDDAFPLEAFNTPPKVLDLLKEFIRERHNLIIAGAPGSGKTSLMRSLLELIPTQEHLVVLEDTHELRLRHPHTTSLLGREEEKGKSLFDHCAHVLRMSPDRLVLGEMRSREALPFVLAMNIGHKGMMSTLHANSAAEAPARLCLLFCLHQQTPIDYPTAMQMLCRGIDSIVHMEHKEVTEVIRLIGSEGQTPFFEYLYRKE